MAGAAPDLPKWQRKISPLFFFVDIQVSFGKMSIIEERKKGFMMSNKYALRFDGFIQSSVYSTVEDAKVAYRSAVKNTLLYEYDCAVVMIDNDRKVIRVLSFEELK